MAELVEHAVGAANADLAFGWPGRVLAYRGRVSAAHEQFGRGIRSAERGGLSQLAAELTLEDAEIHAIAGQCREVPTKAAAGLELSREYFVLIGASRALALCGAASGANDLLTELSEAVSPGDPLDARAPASRRGADCASARRAGAGNRATRRSQAA